MGASLPRDVEAKDNRNVDLTFTIPRDGETLKQRLIRQTCEANHIADMREQKTNKASKVIKKKPSKDKSIKKSSSSSKKSM